MVSSASLFAVGLGVSTVVGASAKEIVATHQWQKIGPDDTLPAGLEIRIDLTTGEKWARQAQQPPKQLRQRHPHRCGPSCKDRQEQRKEMREQERNKTTKTITKNYYNENTNTRIDQIDNNDNADEPRTENVIHGEKPIKPGRLRATPPEVNGSNMAFVLLVWKKLHRMSTTDNEFYSLNWRTGCASMIMALGFVAAFFGLYKRQRRRKSQAHKS